MKKVYRSSIPAKAIERVKTRHSNGSKCTCHYFLNRKKVGVRFFSDDGFLELEYAVKNRKTHGRWFEWISGKLVFAETIRNGASHGTAMQWSSVTGKLIGKFTMKRGTGIDLWWHDWPGAIHLSEACFFKDGKPHGFEWGWLDNSGLVYFERHWWKGRWHGIYRFWKDRKMLSKGFPKFFIRNQQVSKSNYIKASQKDPTLPVYRRLENRPLRTFPASLRPHLKKK